MHHALTALELQTTSRVESYYGLQYRTWMHGLSLSFYILAATSKAAGLPLLALPLGIELAVIRHWSKKSYSTLSLTCILSVVGAFLAKFHLAANAELGSASDQNAANLNITVNKDFEEKAIAAFSFYLLRPFQVFEPRCVHYSFDKGWELSELSRNPCTLAAGPSFLMCFCTISAVLVILAIMTRSIWFQRLVTSLVLSFVLSTPGILASAAGLHGAVEGGAAHDRYGLLAQSLVILPIMAIVFSWCSLRALQVAKTLEPEFDHPDATRILQILSILLSLLPSLLLTVTVATTSLERTYRKWDTTETLWRDAIDQNPNDRHALASLGEYYAIGCEGLSCQKAINLMERSIEGKIKLNENGIPILDSDQSKEGNDYNKLGNLHFNLGTVLYRSGKITDARFAFRRAAQLRPLDREAVWRHIKLCGTDPVDPKAFFSHLDNALNVLASNSDDPKARPRIEWIAEQHSRLTTNGIKYLDGVISFLPKHFSCYIYTMKAVEHHRKRHLKLAAAAYKLAMSSPRDSRCESVRLNLARVYLALREYAHAKAQYAVWLKIHPNDKEAALEFEEAKANAPDLLRDFHGSSADEIMNARERFIVRRYGKTALKQKLKDTEQDNEVVTV